MLTPLQRRKRLRTHRRLHSICLLLSIQPIRKGVLQHVSAFDAAKLDLLRLLTLTSWERERYLRPVRDLVWDTDDHEALSREGMSLVLLGDAAHVLKQRLDEPRRYQAAQGARKLSVYLVGTFPILPRPPEALSRLVSFSVFGESSPARALADERHVRQIQWATQVGELRTFLMAFGVPAAPHRSKSRGVWHRMPDVPDKTIDARALIPTLYDRLHEEVRITPRDLLHLSRLGDPPYLELKPASKLEQWAHAMHRLCKIVMGRAALPAGVLVQQGEGGMVVRLNVLLDMRVYSRLYPAIVIS